MNHQQKMAGYCLDDTLSQAEQKSISLNTMTIVYLLRENDYWTKRFSGLYALAVFFSDASRGQKVLTTKQFFEFVTILDVPAQELVKNLGQTKKRHSYFQELLASEGRLSAEARIRQSKEKKEAQPASASSAKKPRAKALIPDSDEDLHLGALLGDILDNEDLSLGHLLD